MWVSVQCWSAVPADEHASCTSRLPVSFCSISGHACEGKDMHRPCTSHKAAVYCEWKRQLELCVGLQQNIGAPHTVHAHHAHTHTHTHTHNHTHTHTHTNTQTHTHTHTHTHACMHAHTQTRTHMHTHTRAHTRTHTHSIQQVLEGPYTPTTKVSQFDSHSRKFSLAKI